MRRIARNSHPLPPHIRAFHSGRRGMGLHPQKPIKRTIFLKGSAPHPKNYFKQDEINIALRETMDLAAIAGEQINRLAPQMDQKLEQRNLSHFFIAVCTHQLNHYSKEILDAMPKIQGESIQADLFDATVLIMKMISVLATLQRCMKLLPKDFSRG